MLFSQREALSPCQLCLQQAAAIFLRSSMNRISRRDLPTALQFQKPQKYAAISRRHWHMFRRKKPCLPARPSARNYCPEMPTVLLHSGNFTDSAKPTLLVVGGSSGSRAINTAIRDLLPELIKNYNVIHLCGKGNVDTSLNCHRRLCPV